MSAITISNLAPPGLSLFQDQESYLADISSTELGMVNGGATVATTVATPYVSGLFKEAVFVTLAFWGSIASSWVASANVADRIIPAPGRPPVNSP